MKNNRINRKSGFTLIELLVNIILAAIAIGILTAAVGKFVGTSDGKRVGVLTKFSHRGLFIKEKDERLGKRRTDWKKTNGLENFEKSC